MTFYETDGFIFLCTNGDSCFTWEWKYSKAYKTYGVIDKDGRWIRVNAKEVPDYIKLRIKIGV